MKVCTSNSSSKHNLSLRVYDTGSRCYHMGNAVLQLWLETFALLEHAQTVAMNPVLEQTVVPLGVVTMSSVPIHMVLVVLKAELSLPAF